MAKFECNDVLAGFFIDGRSDIWYNEDIIFRGHHLATLHLYDWGGYFLLTDMVVFDIMKV